MQHSSDGLRQQEFRYCGLTVRSNFPLEIASAAAGTPAFDVCLLSSQARLPEPDNWVYGSQQGGEPWLSVAVWEEGCLLRFHRLADFRLTENNRRIECLPRQGAPPETIRHLLLDQALPMALARQGRIVLHGGAVQTGRGAVVVLGESGWGKSTLAAALARRGCPLLTDDCLLLEERDGQYHCEPSYPAVRLWPDSLSSLFGE